MTDILLLALLLMSLASCTVTSLETDVETQQSQNEQIEQLDAVGVLPQQQEQVTPGEFRGVWIHLPTGVGDWGWDKSIRVLASQGFNAIFVNLIWPGTSEYPSDVLSPHPSLLQKDGSCRDLLRECSDACRKYGVQLHVWIVCCKAGHRTPDDVKKRFQQEGRLQVGVGNGDDVYIAPQMPANRQMICDAVKEILLRYPVDGIHLDYIRYPGADFDYGEQARADFQRDCNVEVAQWPKDCQKQGVLYDKFLKWKQDNITNLVREVRAAIKASARPQTSLSAAVYGWWPGARANVAQDTAKWVDEGLVDFICPMNYSADRWDAARWLREQLGVVKGRVPIYTGLGVYMCKDAAAVAAQIDDARRYGADGFVCFQYRPPLSDQWLPELHKEAVPGWSAGPYAHQLDGISCQWEMKWPGRAELLLGKFMAGDTLMACVTIPKWMPKDDHKCTVLLDGKPVHCHLSWAWHDEKRKCDYFFPAKEPGFYRIRLEWQEDGKECVWLSQPVQVHPTSMQLLKYVGSWVCNILMP